MVVALLFGSFALLLILRVPIGISLGMSSLITIFASGVVQPTYLAQGLVTGADSFSLMAVPFFVLAGELMATGGISRRLLNIADAFLGRKYGGLALVTVVACMFFAAISGSGPATVAAIGGLTIPSSSRAMTSPSPAPSPPPPVPSASSSRPPSPWSCTAWPPAFPSAPCSWAA